MRVGLRDWEALGTPLSSVAAGMRSKHLRSDGHGLWRMREGNRAPLDKREPVEPLLVIHFDVGEVWRQSEIPLVAETSLGERRSQRALTDKGMPG